MSKPKSAEEWAEVFYKETSCMHDPLPTIRRLIADTKADAFEEAVNLIIGRMSKTPYPTVEEKAMDAARCNDVVFLASHAKTLRQSLETKEKV